jgi:4-alpha-glucanotransferase
LKSSERYFDLFRIDHVVGIYRVWGIKEGCKAVEGSFYPPDEREWIPQGMSAEETQTILVAHTVEKVKVFCQY